MTDAADDLMEIEEERTRAQQAHQNGVCAGDCVYCEIIREAEDAAV